MQMEDYTDISDTQALRRFHQVSLGFPKSGATVKQSARNPSVIDGP
jgi:hypothetical protein